MSWRMRSCTPLDTLLGIHLISSLLETGLVMSIEWLVSALPCDEVVCT